MAQEGIYQPPAQVQVRRGAQCRSAPDSCHAVIRNHFGRVGFTAVPLCLLLAVCEGSRRRACHRCGSSLRNQAGLCGWGVNREQGFQPRPVIADHVGTYQRSKNDVSALVRAPVALLFLVLVRAFRFIFLIPVHYVDSFLMYLLLFGVGVGCPMAGL